MTREKARKLLPIIQAYAEGKQIEVDTHEEGWKVCDNLDFDSEPEKYRTKREPKYRPFENCNELIQFCDKHYCNNNRPKGTLPLIWVKSGDYHSLITSFDISCDEVLIDGTRYDLIDLFKNFTFLDGTTCGIEVTE